MTLKNNKWTEEELTQKALIDECSLNFKDILNPTYKVCAYAVSKRPANIQYIKNPSFELCKRAVKRSIHNLKYIDPISEELANYALSMDCEAKAYIHFPVADEIIRMCAEKHSNFLAYFPKSPLELIEINIKQHGTRVFNFFHLPSHEVQNHFVDFLDITMLKNINNPSELILLKACSLYKTGENISIHESFDNFFIKNKILNNNPSSIVLFTLHSLVNSQIKMEIEGHRNYRTSARMILDSLMSA